MIGNETGVICPVICGLCNDNKNKSFQMVCVSVILSRFLILNFLNILSTRRGGARSKRRPKLRRWAEHPPPLLSFKMTRMKGK